MKRKRRSDEAKALQPLRSGGETSLDEQAAARLIEGYRLPPASQLTVQRIWQRVVSAPELQASGSRSRLPGLLAPSLALCLVVALGFVLLRDRVRPASRAAPAVGPAPVAQLAAAQGGVFFTRPTERWQPGEEGQPLVQGQSLRTDTSGRALMDVPGIASVLISRGTEIAIERLSGGTFLRLSRGSVVARVSKRPPGEPFFVLTHRFSVKVVGTLFQVEQDASDRTAVSVRDGVVEITGGDGRSWRVGAGEKWSSVSPEQLGASAIADPVKTLLEDGLKRAERADLDRELGAIDGIATGGLAGAGLRAGGLGGEPSIAPLPESPLGVEVPQGAASRNGLAAVPEHGKRSGGLRAGEFVPRPGAGGLPSGQRSLLAAAPLPPPPVILAARDPGRAPESMPGLGSAPAPGQASPPATRFAPVATYAEGLALERAGKIQAAAEELIRAEKDDPAHAGLALYALGRLRQHRLRDPQGALEAFDTYRRTYPSGPLLAEVDLAILEIEVAAGHRDQALAESVRFLASHPASERIVEVHLLRGDLLRERGDCRSALAEYLQVDAAAFAEEALFETAYCQRKLGEVAAARESLRQYRRRYPNGAHRDDVAKALRE